MSDLSKIMTPIEYLRAIDEDSRINQYNEYEVAQYIELYNDYVVSALANDQLESTSSLPIGDITHSFCVCDGHKYSETEICSDCGKPFPPY